MLLRLAGVERSFSGVRALRGVSFDLAAGEVHAVVGENGAGKSTMIRMITGADRPDAGTLELAGTSAPLDPALARSLGVAAIYQQPALFPDLDVAENIALGSERGGAWRRVRWAARAARAKELLASIGSSIDPSAPARELSMAEQQLVEIAKALGAEARVFVMDEPTAALPDAEARALRRVVGELRSRGAGIVYITHRLEELPGMADRVTVLRDGRSVATRPMAELSRDELIRLMVGREVAQEYPARDAAPGDVVLSLRGLGSRAAGVRGVSLEVRAGEIVGLAGLVGAGRTELARVLFGLVPADEGEILLDGRPVAPRSPREASALGLALVPEDRRRHGVVGELSVAANAGLAILDRLSRFGFLDGAAERRVAEDFVATLGVKTPSVDAPAGHLSGGNQQKVALARWLAAGPRLLILDEPTQGIDVGAKAEIHRLMGRLAGQGLAVLMISSDLPEVLGMSDRVAVMRGGTIAGVLGRAEATPESVLALALGAGRAA